MENSFKTNKNADDHFRFAVLFVTGTILFLNVIILLFNLIDVGPTARFVVLLVTALLFVVFLLALRGYLRPAQLTIPVVIFLGAAYFLIARERGIHHPVIIGIPAVIVLGGLLLGQNGAAAFTILTTILVGGLAYAEYAELIPVDYALMKQSISLDGNVFWIMNLTTGLIIFFTIRFLTQTIKQAQVSEEKQTQSNIELTALKNSLQERVAIRTSTLEVQNRNLQAVSRVAHEILKTNGIVDLLELSVNMISEEFGYEYVGIFLLDEKRERAVLQAASSDGGKKLIAQGYQLAVGAESIISTAISEKRSHISIDINQASHLINAPELPDNRSTMILPLIIQDDVLGVLDIRSAETQAFSQDNLAIFQSLANQIALAIQNARLVEEAQINLMQLQLVVAEQSRDVWEKHLRKQSYGLVYTPLGVKPLKTASPSLLEGDEERTNVPIILRGKKIGDITLQRISRRWSSKEKALLADVASQIGLAIENARLLNETREQANQDQLVSEVSSKLRETLDMDTVLKTAIEEIKKTFNLKEAEVRLMAPDESEAKR